tara:strand:+ start:716 stop:859 length:144 start_codon:yes stop_codon:yes gene_type:complete
MKRPVAGPQDTKRGWKHIFFLIFCFFFIKKKDRNKGLKVPLLDFNFT